jgi:threonine synthase
VACASTGNTSSSMAAYAARAGLKALVFVPPGRISSAKLAQALDFGAFVLELGGTFDEAFRLVRQISPELGLYLVNSVNPFRLEGQKTLVPELLEQRDWNPPDYIVVPGGNLGNTSRTGLSDESAARGGHSGSACKRLLPLDVVRRKRTRPSPAA